MDDDLDEYSDYNLYNDRLYNDRRDSNKQYCSVCGSEMQKGSYYCHYCEGP